jgi:hypothetical protein
MSFSFSESPSVAHCDVDVLVNLPVALHGFFWFIGSFSRLLSWACAEGFCPVMDWRGMMIRNAKTVIPDRITVWIQHHNFWPLGVLSIYVRCAWLRGCVLFYVKWWSHIRYHSERVRVDEPLNHGCGSDLLFLRSFCFLWSDVYRVYVTIPIVLWLRGVTTLSPLTQWVSAKAEITWVLPLVEGPQPQTNYCSFHERVLTCLLGHPKLLSKPEWVSHPLQIWCHLSNALGEPSSVSAY